ncbi:TetR/AcrR family transcriptional regulator [uncultured Microbacterium sp.]|uniref:TetR/AcrR family transcriptional regulator n=1 Tax=uncultured Microbacterium sp. TaxID=191216 RepID=UPI0035CC00D6
MPTPVRARSGSRGPVGRLDLETIVAAGLEIAARPGAKTLSVRELGAHLKADPTAIYRHVDNKDDLIRLLIDRLIGLSADRITVPPSDWKAYLRESATGTLDVFLRYPAIGSQATHLSSKGSQELRQMEGILAAFEAAGLDERQVVRYYGIWSIYALSFSAGAAQDRMHSVDPQSETLWVDRDLDVDASQYPRVHSARDELNTLTDVAAYLDGVELIIESAEGAAHRQTRAAD